MQKLFKIFLTCTKIPQSYAALFFTINFEATSIMVLPDLKMLIKVIL